MGPLRSIYYFLEEALINFWRHKTAGMISLLTIGISIFILGFFLFLDTNFNRITKRWTEKIHINLFLKDGIAESDIKNIKSKLNKTEDIENYKFISKQEALKNFTKDFSKLNDITESLDNNPLPASFDITVKPANFSQEEIRSLAGELSGLKGVEETEYDSQWVQRLRTFSFITSIIGYSVSAVLALTSFFTISNVIKLAIFSRSDEIKIMKLVGATPVYIKGPFYLEGVLQGFLGSFTGVSILYLFYRIFDYYLTEKSLPVFEFFDLSFLSPAFVLGLIIGGSLAGLAASWMGVKRFM